MFADRGHSPYRARRISQRVMTALTILAAFSKNGAFHALYFSQHGRHASPTRPQGGYLLRSARRS